VALAEVAFAGGLGIEIDLRKVPRADVDRNDLILFSESQSRFIVTITPANKKTFEAMMKEVVCGEVGVVSDHNMLRVLGLEGKKVIEASIDDLKEVWQKPLNF
jgi:phosphoribosylformylglycinamidine synthase